MNGCGWRGRGEEIVRVSRLGASRVSSRSRCTHGSSSIQVPTRGAGQPKGGRKKEVYCNLHPLKGCSSLCSPLAHWYIPGAIALPVHLFPHLPQCRAELNARVWPLVIYQNERKCKYCDGVNAKQKCM